MIGVALAVAAAAIGLTVAQGADDNHAAGDEPLPLPGAPAPEADEPGCSQLLENLPEELPDQGDELVRRELAEPAPPASTAWGADDPVVLRCGVEAPAELEETSPLRAVNDVEWLPVEGDGMHTWHAVDRDVYVALTIPDDRGTGPLQLVSEIIAETLEPAPVEAD